MKPLKSGTPPQETQFECKNGLCSAREQGGLIVTHTNDPAQRSTACAEADIVILAFAGSEAACNEESVPVITQRDLALRGAAARGGNVSGLRGRRKYGTGRAACCCHRDLCSRIARSRVEFRIERIRAPPATLENTSLANAPRPGPE